MQHVGDSKPWHMSSSQLLIGRMKINFLLNWTWCSGNRDANLRGRAFASWQAADTSWFMRSKHKALPFPLPLPGLELSCERNPPHPLPNSSCKTTCHKRQSMQLLLATAHLLKAGLIAHLSVRSPQAHARVQVYPVYPSPHRGLSESHGSN